MSPLAQKTSIKEAYSKISDISFQEKTNPLINEERLNQFLDSILELKENLKEKSVKIELINERLEKLTWFTNLNQECLIILNGVIAATKDLHTSLWRQYVQLQVLAKKGIAKVEIKEFKSTIDDLKESYADLESVFFFLPEMPEFREVTKKLSLI